MGNGVTLCMIKSLRFVHQFFTTYGLRTMRTASKFLVVSDYQIDKINRIRNDSDSLFTIDRANVLCASAKKIPIQTIHEILGLSYAHVNSILVAFKERGIDSLTRKKHEHREVVTQ